MSRREVQEAVGQCLSDTAAKRMPFAAHAREVVLLRMIYAAQGEPRRSVRDAYEAAYPGCSLFFLFAVQVIAALVSAWIW